MQARNPHNNLGTSTILLSLPGTPPCHPSQVPDEDEEADFTQEEMEALEEDMQADFEIAEMIK